MIAVMLVLLGLLSLRMGHTAPGWVLAVLGALVLLFPFLRLYVSLGRTVSQYGLSAEPKLFYTVRFDEGGLHIRNASQKADYRWDQIYHVCAMESRQIIYLYLARTTAFLLPYEGFDPGEKEDLLRQIRKRCGDSKVSVYEKQPGR